MTSNLLNELRKLKILHKELKGNLPFYYHLNFTLIFMTYKVKNIVKFGGNGSKELM